MNILTKEILSTDQEISLRPSYLLEFVGQEHIKPNLDTFIQATKGTSERLDHTLFHGPPGLGKTTLAHIVAKELGAAFYSTSAPALSKPADLVGMLTQLGRRDVLFIDEIHRLHIKIEEILYQAMEDFSVDVIIGEGPTARSVKIDLQPFTLIGATTRLGLLSKPLTDRFGIPLRLNFYKPEELKKILIRASHLLNISLLEGGAYEIALRSRGTARIALRILRRVRDFAAVDNIKEIDQKVAIKALNRLDIDSLGLDNNDRIYLRFIANNYNGGPVGLNTIATALSEQVKTIEDTIEPYLIQIGLMHITSRGRVITQSAFSHLGLDQSIE